EPVRVETQLRNEIQVLDPPVVAVARHRSVRAVVDGAGHLAEGVPDGGGAAVSPARALDLEGRAAYAPQERVPHHGCSGAGRPAAAVGSSSSKVAERGGRVMVPASAFKGRGTS